MIDDDQSWDLVVRIPGYVHRPPALNLETQRRGARCTAFRSLVLFSSFLEPTHPHQLGLGRNRGRCGPETRNTQPPLLWRQRYPIHRDPGRGSSRPGILIGSRRSYVGTRHSSSPSGGFMEEPHSGPAQGWHRNHPLPRARGAPLKPKSRRD